MKKITYILIWALGFVGLYACSESEYEIEKIVPEEYHKILYVNDSGMQDMVLYKTGEDFKYSFSVFKAGSDPTLSANAQVAIMSQEELDDRYSEVSGINYKILPNSYYELKTSQLGFSSSDTYKLVDIMLKPEATESLLIDNPDVSWVLPIKVSSGTDSISTAKNNIVLHITDVVLPMASFNADKPELKNFPYAKRENIDIKVPVVLTVPNQWSFGCTMELDEAYIAQYNAANNTYFKPLPAGTFTFDEQVAFTSSETQANMNVKVTTTELPVGDYMLPIRLKEVDKFVLSPQKNVYALAIKVLAPELNREGWTATANTEERGGEGPVNGYVTALLDGNLNTFWHSKWNGGTFPLPHEIVIDMKSAHEVNQIGLAPRINNRYVKSGDFYISADNLNWEKVGEFTMIQSSNDLQIFNTTHMNGRYVKVVIRESYNAPHSALGEVYVYGF